MTVSPRSHADDRGLFEALPDLLDRLIGAHELWLDALGAHQRGIGAADVAAIESAVAREREQAEAVRTLDLERRKLLGLPERAIPGANEITITALARSRPEPERGELLERADRLRKLIERVRRDQAVVREASGSVLSHMRGLMQQLSGRLSHSGTYGAGGRVNAGPVVVSGLDIRQ